MIFVFLGISNEYKILFVVFYMKKKRRDVPRDEEKKNHF